MLSVPCATIRTPPLATHGFPTISADEKRSVFRAIPIERKINIGHQQQIAHIVEAQNAKHDVVDGADALWKMSSTAAIPTMSIAQTDERKMAKRGGTEKGLSVGWK